jgi:O-methyltransferase
MNPTLRKTVPQPVIRIARRLWSMLTSSPMMTAFVDREAFFSRAMFVLSTNGIDGDYVEFGCHSGQTFAMAWREIRRNRRASHLWAFDSFQGMPDMKCQADEHPEWIAGTMATSLEQFVKICTRNHIPPNRYTAIKGFYSDTLHSISWPAPPTTIALVYVDCDMYSSTMDVLNFLEPRFRHGTILAFDDYFNFSAKEQAGEQRAFTEFQQRTSQWNFLPYLSIGGIGMSFIVQTKYAISEPHTGRDEESNETVDRPLSNG